MFAIAELTLRKMKEPAFFIMLAIALVLAFMTSGFDSLSDQMKSDSIFAGIINSGRGEEKLLTSTFFIFGISAILAGFLGAAEIPRDISSGLILLIMSKPVKKYEYMLGKYFGIFGVCMIFFTFSEAVVVTSSYLCRGNLYSFPCILRQFELAAAFIPYTAIVVAISCFAGELASIILTAMYLLISLSFNLVPILAAMLPAGFAGQMEKGIFMIYYLFPNYIYYFQDHRLLGVVFIFLMVYSFAIAAIFLCIAAMKLETMDFTSADS